jgi:hypothetical protein
MEPYINYQDIAILTPFQYAVFQGNNSIIRLLSLFCLKKSKEDFSAHLEACKTLWLSLPNTEKKAQCLQILETIASYCKPGEAKEWGHTFFDGARGTRYTKEVHKLSYKDIKQNTIIISPSSLEPLESTSLPLSFQGKILDESALKQVETENSRMYAWLDREALGTTETSLYLQERFYERRLILDEDCLKHISSSGKLTACIKIEGKSYQFSYEFELKQYGTPARILFCQLPLDHQRGSLLVGLHFAPKGLHEKNAIYSLVESAAAKVIAVSLPFIKPPALSISI